jgi:hypothetical protein
VAVDFGFQSYVARWFSLRNGISPKGEKWHFSENGRQLSLAKLIPI